ncbi:M20 family metallopeptidase [Gemmatimonadota bacterium]
MEISERILTAARAEKEAMVDFLLELVRRESPSDVPESQGPVQELLTSAFQELGYQVTKVPGKKTGGHLYARPKERARGRPAQLLLGHSDTVWPVGTLDTMPAEVAEGRLRGPGAFDMKAGLTQMVFALRILRSLDLEPAVTPVALVNSDEEIGSPESKRVIRLLARRVVRVLIPEPAMGPEGKLKTARKGVSRFTVRVFGRAAHAGLDPEGGASAILELSYLIQALHTLTDPERGVTVNVGLVAGGTRPNVIAPEAEAEVDVRVLALKDAEEVEERIRALEPTVPGVTVEVEGGLLIPPLEATPRNRVLWEAARAVGAELGLTLEETVAGGGSDGNTTSQFTATLDGLGAVGDGAHAPHEFLYVDPQVERCALLARLLLLPA